MTSSRLGRQDFSLAVHHLESGVRAWATHGLPGSLAHSRSPTRAHQGHALTTHPLTLLLPHHSVSHLIPLGQAWAQSGLRPLARKPRVTGLEETGNPALTAPQTEPAWLRVAENRCRPLGLPVCQGPQGWYRGRPLVRYLEKAATRDVQADVWKERSVVGMRGVDLIPVGR